MPKQPKTQISFDGPRQAITKFWKENIVELAPFWIFLTFLAGFCGMIIRHELRQDYIEEQRSLEIDGVTYVLEDAHQVSTEMDDTTFDINFLSQTVVVHREEGANRVIMFPEFDDQSFIDEAHDAGLRIAYQIAALPEDKKRNNADEYQDLFNDAAIFTRRYTTRPSSEQIVSGSEETAPTLNMNGS